MTQYSPHMLKAVLDDVHAEAGKNDGFCRRLAKAYVLSMTHDEIAEYYEENGLGFDPMSGIADLTEEEQAVVVRTMTLADLHLSATQEDLLATGIWIGFGTLKRDRGTLSLERSA